MDRSIDIDIDVDVGEVENIANKIEKMEIRGASNIAKAAVEALKIYTLNSRAESSGDFKEGLDRTAERLLNTRPTAVSLKNSLNWVLNRVKSGDIEEMRKEAIKASDDFILFISESRKKIAEIGSKRIRDGDVILTHCNSAAALGVIKEAYRSGKEIKVFASETRPRGQGYITAGELADSGIDVTLIIDSAIRYFMHQIDIVFVGADTVASNGAVINKIGTSQVAISAHEARVPFFVCTETYKFSPETVDGRLVPIEERDAREIADIDKFSKIKFKNPAFDATPPRYIDGIITEKGIIPPSAAYMIISSMWK